MADGAAVLTKSAVGCDAVVLRLKNAKIDENLMDNNRKDKIT